ncbi:MAG: helix-turn-helix domain-containing protein [Syntrophobacteraceae bacterium]|nr:helix-turn-helix domain-containing protein [Syntrophobacteraceae bacterium]
MERETGPRVSIEEAANLLGLSTKTIQRHLASGLLTKVKIHHRTWLLKSEVEDLGRSRRAKTDRESARTAFQAATTDIVSISRARYESLLIELGELRKECELLAAAEARRQELELALRATEAELARTRKLLDQSREARGTAEGESGYDHPDRPEPGSKGRPPTRKPWWQK